MPRAAIMEAEPLPADHQMGANNPPEPTPFDTIKLHIDSLYEEAGNFADGEPVATQGQADAVSFLIDQLRKAANVAEDHRKAEAKPFDDGKAEVQGRYNPLIQKDRGKVDMAVAACKKALAPFLRAQQDEIDRKAAEARKAADEATRVAREAAQAAQQSSNLAEREAAEQLITDAKRAEAVATRAGNERAGGDSGAKRITLRDNYVCTLADETELLRHFWTANRPALVACALDLAKAEVRAGKRAVPGCTVENHPVPV